MRPVIVAVGLSVVLVVAGCGGDDDGDSSASSTSRSTSSSSTSSTTVTSTTTTVPCTFSGTTTPQQLPPVEVQYLTDVSAVRNGCVDVLTFTFRPSAAPAPSYQISYEPGPFYNSAGVEVRPAGTAFLKIRFEPAWIADLEQENAPATYTGPKDITPTGLNAVRQLTMFDASEAVVAWVAGVDGQRPFRVEPSAGKVVITLGP